MECDALAALLTAGATIVLALLAFFQMKATRDQSAAALQQAEVTREAASRQIYPLMYAHAWGPPRSTQEEVIFRYYLSNEGLGPALNIEHGVEISGRAYPFGGEQASQFRTAQPGEFLPPLERPTDTTPSSPISRHVAKSDLGEDGVADEVIYWCRYESLFGERWETRNPANPTQPPELRHLGG